ncbi:hypothetical protein M9Y10_033015 [Tritrichomonas musculus]|uniref:Uncharacterized protein n=1 Tax=Tritrichomonas musculus TaxID=1915356 RepID=A0ABR2GWU5_9EUKA
MSSAEVLVTPINSTEMNEAGQLAVLNNSITSNLLGLPTVKNEESIPQKRNTKRSHRKKRTREEILASCDFTACNVILDVSPTGKYRFHPIRSSRVRTYHTYEEYLAAKEKRRQEEGLQDLPEDSDIVSESEFLMSDDTEAFEEIQIEEKSILDDEIQEEKRFLAEEILEQYIQPHSLVEIRPDRNFCYDNVAANIDRGMPGNPLEREIEEQEAQELKEIEDDIQFRQSMLYPENPLATHLELNFASDQIRNDFGAETTLDESAFSVSEINQGLISLSPGSPRSSPQKVRNICQSGIITLLSVNPDDEKVARYRDERKNKKRYTHVRRYRTTDKTNELNASMGPTSGAVSNVKLESKSTLAVFTDSEENNKNEEDKSLQKAIKEENQLEEEKSPENDEEKENNHVFEGTGMSIGNNNLTHEYSDLTIYSEEEKMKSSECERLKEEIKEERKEDNAEKRREYEEAKLNLPDIPPTDIIPNGDGTIDVGIQAIRCDLDEILNRRPRKIRQSEIPYADYAAFAIQPRVLVNVQPDRNACYDNINDAIDRGTPGNPLEEELEEQEAFDEKEREDDLNFYISTLYREDAIHTELRGSADSDALRAEFGNRPPEEPRAEEPIIEEEEEENDTASSENSEAEITAPSEEASTKSPRIKRRVKKVVHKNADTQCAMINVEPIEKVRDLIGAIPDSQEPTNSEPKNDNAEANADPGALEDAANTIMKGLTNNDENENENDNTEANINPLENAASTFMKGLTNNDENENDNTEANINPTLENAANTIIDGIANDDENADGNDNTETNINPTLENAANSLMKGITNNDQNENDDENDNENAEQEQQDSGILQDKASSIFSAMLNNNESEKSDGFQKIQMPKIDVDSSSLSPRIKSPRQASIRCASKNAYRPYNSSRGSPRYNTRSLDASSPSINRLKERAYRLEPIANATNEQLELLIDEIEQEKKIFMRDRRFRDSLKCNAAIKHVEGILSKQQREQSTPTPETEMEMAFDTESRKREAKLIEKQNLARKKLKAKHKKELEELNKQWDSFQMRKKYNKLSDKLIAMKEQYETMIASENPDEEEANKLKEEIQELRKLETSEAHQRMQADYDRALLQLHQKHHQDFALLSESNNVRFDQFKQQRARERRALDFKKTEFNNEDQKDEECNTNNMIAAQSERFESDALGNLFDSSDAPRNIDTNDSEKLNLPPLDTRKPKNYRFANPGSS